MKLKRLCLSGFKTFADRTEIELSEGITAVVGPNGCGKSNIADAILWALGEQNPRLLRGTDSREFVFAGAERRRPLGMAEVQVVVDNSDGSMPIEFAEVAIARRIYRSGESRYSINGVACRLKDIVDLFLDTGMGRGAYSFITQSEVDAVLSARPEDRRELLEEAAGVQKYRTRKRESLRKLETAELNMTRINDIVGELERQREPLQGQAVKAERYLAATERLRSVEVDLLIAEIHRCDYELYAARTDRDDCISGVRELDERLANLERDASRARESLAEAEKEQEAASLSRQGAATQVERTEHQLQLTLERELNARETAQTLEMEMHALAEREQALTETLKRERSALQRAQSAEEERRSELKAARLRLSELDEAVSRAEALGRDQALAQKRLLAERAARESALAACRTRIDEAGRRLAELEDERERAGLAAAAAEERRRTAEEHAADLRKALRQAEAAHRDALGRRRDAEDALERAEAEAASVRRRMIERRSRLETLKEMQAAGEGLFQGVRAVLRASRDGALSGEYSAVVDILTVPEPLRTAVDVALGSSAQNIICASAAEARSAIEWLKSGRRGRATFLPLDSVEPPPKPAIPKSAQTRGLVGIGSDVVSTAAKFRRAVDLLLNRVVLVEDLDAAMKVARSLSGWSRIVTLEGELLTPGGAVTGGAGAGRGPQLVNRKGEIDDLTAETQRLGEELQAKEEAVAGAQQTVSEAAERAQEASEANSQAATGSMAAERDLDAAQREATAIRSRVEDIEAQQRRVAATLEQVEAESRTWEAALTADRDEDSAFDEALEAAQKQAADCAGLAAAARGEVTRIEVELGRLGEQVRALRRSASAAETGLAETQGARRSRQQKREALGRALAEAERTRDELTAAGAEARAKLEECTKVHDVWRTERSKRLDASFQISGTIKETTARRSQTMDALHDADLKTARLEVWLSQVSQRLNEEYGMTPEEALAAPEPPEMDRDTVNEIARLRREIRAMGNVNTGAADEFRRLTERHEFLCAQRGDLEVACASLRETIAEIDRSTRAVFTATYEAVAAEFQRLFARLFDGGETQLVLTKPDDLLETGIEVIVKPPGKRSQNLSLLSGGERALTAVALLFSLLAVRPSPFVLLDEVDASLDGQNVERFVELVQDFSRGTQFVVITHNPTTMEGAPRWYGVTMQEPGVSRVISYLPLPSPQPAASEA